MHRGVDLVARAVKESGVDERDTVRGSSDAGSQVDARAPLLIHDADLDGAGRQAEHLLDARERLTGERDLIGPMQLRLHDVDGTCRRVRPCTRSSQIVQGARDSDHRVEQSLRHRARLGVEDSITLHQQADIAHEHQAASPYRQFLTVRSCVGPVRLCCSHERTAAFRDRRLERPLLQPEPVPPRHDLVLGIHGGDGVLEIHDGSERGLEYDISYSGRVVTTDRMFVVDHELYAESMVTQQHRGRGVHRPAVTDEEFAVSESAHISITTAGAERDSELSVDDAETGDVSPGASGEGHDIVKEPAGPRDHLGAAFRVIRARLGCGADRIGAVERIVERTPPRVRSVQRIAGIGDGHDELRTGDVRDLRIDATGRHLHGGRLVAEVADLAQERFVRFDVDGPGSGTVPVVDDRLQPLALCE